MVSIINASLPARKPKSHSWQYSVLTLPRQWNRVWNRILEDGNTLYTHRNRRGAACDNFPPRVLRSGSLMRRVRPSWIHWSILIHQLVLYEPHKLLANFVLIRIEQSFCFDELRPQSELVKSKHWSLRRSCYWLFSWPNFYRIIRL